MYGVELWSSEEVSSCCGLYWYTTAPIFQPFWQFVGPFLVSTWRCPIQKSWSMQKQHSQFGFGKNLRDLIWPQPLLTHLWWRTSNIKLGLGADRTRTLCWTRIIPCEGAQNSGGKSEIMPIAQAHEFEKRCFANTNGCNVRASPHFWPQRIF